ncbi:phenylalanine--tRNA ligase subunit alpha, partial [Candidatus Peregrinibacteria bacterium]|nr:phenylalanine--tRNA ligase subunit alpha [Candidatus Peregrinibacteria bacterium]
DPLDLTIDLPPSPRGHLHPIPSFLEEIDGVFGRMGFDIAYGPEIETEELQFDLLNFPKEHAARDAQDIFYLQVPSKPRNRWLLRGHTSPVQIRYMRTHPPPFRMICPGKVYRKDDDATHSPMFHQVEGMMIDRDISLANMKAIMIAAVQELISPATEFRFRTGYFPFVEPGMEMDMRWKSAKGEHKDGPVPAELRRSEGGPVPAELRRSEGGPVPAELRRSEAGWMEVAGCGMVHPNVLKNCGIDPKIWQGFAFGFGVERMVMIRDGLRDLRLFFENDPRFLWQF